MQELYLKSGFQPKQYRLYQDECGKVMPNILQRQFSADKPNPKWVTDVTKFNEKEKSSIYHQCWIYTNGEIIAI
jgi:putative transposase